MSDDADRSIAIVIAGLGGEGGDGARLVEHAAPHLVAVRTSRVVLADRPGFQANEATLAEASGFVFVTGTYWDGWSSHLQRFLEEATHTEATSLWLGKPASVWVTAHSVGGKGVLSRLQGVLSSSGARSHR